MSSQIEQPSQAESPTLGSVEIPREPTEEAALNDLAYRFGFRDDWQADKRIAALLRHKNDLDNQIMQLHASGARERAQEREEARITRTACLLGFTKDEATKHGPLRSVIKGVYDAKRLLQKICPPEQEANTTTKIPGANKCQTKSQK